MLIWPPSLSYLLGCPAYSAAEMWYGVVLAIVVELVEPDVKSSTVAIFLFIINNIGGNMPLAVDGLSDVIGYRDALYVLYPGMYFASKCVGCPCPTRAPLGGGGRGRKSPSSYLSIVQK